MKHHLLTTLCVMACTSMQVVNAQQIALKSVPHFLKNFTNTQRL